MISIVERGKRYRFVRIRIGDIVYEVNSSSGRAYVYKITPKGVEYLGSFTVRRRNKRF
ncbi:MAG: hypothetical protein ACPL3C_10465 [Pyrobaculum sp.]